MVLHVPETEPATKDLTMGLDAMKSAMADFCFHEFFPEHTKILNVCFFHHTENFFQSLKNVLILKFFSMFLYTQLAGEVRHGEQIYVQS